MLLGVFAGLWLISRVLKKLALIIFASIPIVFWRNKVLEWISILVVFILDLLTYFFFKLIYLFLAALGLRCCAQAFSSCSKWGLFLTAVRGLHCGGLSCCRARALGVRAQ